jgi:hypothetical protein
MLLGKDAGMQQKPQIHGWIKSRARMACNRMIQDGLEYQT